MNKMIIVEEDQLRQIVSESIKQVLDGENLPKKKNEKDTEPLLTREQMARELHISLVTISDWMKKGLPYLRLNGRIYFLRSEVLASMKHNCLTPSI
ncbi:helix-turn-helix domain-containing protein [Niabella insulamsoli]|uniref:helix-turn-helix domain-containing protein n=1 Tax=Niabella insulamsoli TaxID=3144874 RepID=UPI0031FDEED7